MDPRKLRDDGGLDERLIVEWCAYCGGPADTLDHVPSKVLLDDPVPEYPPRVPACLACNRGFSLDEEYTACFLECVLAGSTDPARLRRPKVQRALHHSPRLAAEIRASSRVTASAQILWTPDAPRIEKVVLKLARGHAYCELSSPQLEAPASLFCVPLASIDGLARERFERGPERHDWPELGTRAFLRAAGVAPYAQWGQFWVNVQHGRYRYRVEDAGPTVFIVLADYLACTVAWR